MSRTTRWYLVCTVVAAAAYGLSIGLIALTGQLTTSNVLWSIAPVVAIFGVLAWWDHPRRRAKR